MRDLTSQLDPILHYASHRAGGCPGVVALVTDRDDNRYEGAAGVRELGKPEAMTLDTVMAIFSTSKAITGTAIMQLIEEGLLNLTDDAARFVPELAELQVLEGFSESGVPRTRPPRRAITVNDLLLHTSGLCYEFFSADDLRYRTAKGIPTIVSGTLESIKTVLLHDPGARWTYGPNIDWLGLIVERLRGERLGAVLKARIFEPLGMHDIGFTLTPSMRARLAVIHDRAANGMLTPQPDLVLPQPPTMDMGGHGLYASIPEYMKFIRMILNDGMGPHGRVLRAETVARMAQDGLANLRCGAWQSSIPSLTNDGEFFPGLNKGWAYTFMTNRTEAPTGRAAGSLAWAGLSNLFYWIDRANGVGGFWGTQILPFHDAASYPCYLEFETAVYRALQT